ncbi:MAG: transposase, partial [Turicibacter sp.]|nr:transposase [Turicibacter sp.]
MKIVSSYKVKIQHYNNIFSGTVDIYRRAVAFFIDVCDKHWQEVQGLTSKKRNNYVEKLTIRTIRNPIVKYDFGEKFYKMPSYLRRAAIQQAIGAYSSYTSNLANWEKSNKKGKKPTLTTARNVMPTLYKDNCYIRTSTTTCKVKIFHKNDWIWLNVHLREQDIKYIDKHCRLSKELVPTLKKQGKMWFLTFPFEENTKLADVAIKQKNICAVDLGLNNNAVCSIMQSDGTVVARKFVNLATEKDHLQKALNRQKK